VGVGTGAARAAAGLEKDEGGSEGETLALYYVRRSGTSKCIPRAQRPNVHRGTLYTQDLVQGGK
jgi:hypothetical protein